jgi:hypothetical protein
MKPLALIAALTILALAGCGGGDSGPAAPAELTVAEAAAGDYEGPAIVTGNVLAVDGVMRMCEMLAESFPPQCGGASILVEGIEPAEVDWIVEAEDVWWTDREVELTGVLSDGVLTVSDNALQ